jgi:hypothetical protein
MAAKKAVTRDSMKTKTGKPRLGPLNVAQLTKLLDGARKRHVPQIKRAIENRTKTQKVSTKVSAVEVAE